MTPSHELRAYLSKIRGLGLAVGCVGAALCAAGYFFRPERFFQAYLFGYVFWLGLTLGSMVVVMIHGLTGGGWGLAIRRISEAGMNTLPLMALLFVPVLFGVPSLYEWSHADVVEHDDVLQSKSAYLNVEGFQIRAGAVFAVWLVTVLLLNRWSPNEDRDPDSPRSIRLQRASGVGFALYGLTVTFAAVDWVMSLEPHWYSSMYGILFAAGESLSGLSFAIIAMTALEPYDPWRRIVNTERRHDLGNLLLAFTMFWAYIAFMQYLIIWSGNLPEENVWYLHRGVGGWELIGMAIMGLSFALPFFLLLLRDVTRRRTRLCQVAGLLLAMQVVNAYWLVEPAFSPGTLTIHWLHIAALAAIGGFWAAMFAWRLQARAFLPIHDPQLSEAVDERAGHAAA
jgi:hypothetical protein